MDGSSPDTLERARSAVFSYERWRENFLQLVLIGATALGFVAAVLSSVDVVRAGNPNLAFVYSGAWVLLLLITVHRWPFALRAAALLALTYAIGLSGLLENGMRGDARLFFLGLTVMTAMLVNIRVALAVSAGTVATIAAVGVLVFTGIVHLSSRTTVPGTIDLWLVSTLDLALLQTMVLTGWFLFLREFTGAQKDVRRSMEALQRERTLLRTVIDNVPDAVYSKDMQGRRQLSNPADAALLGVPAGTGALGMTGAETLPPESAARTLEEDREVLRTGRALFNRETSLPGPGGVTRWLLVSKLPLRSPTGEVIGMVGIDREITELRRAEEERSRLEEQLRLAQRLESMGRLAGGLAHDINNLLLPILGYAELLLTDLPSGEQLADGLRQIKGAALRTRDLTRKLLAFGRAQALRLEPLDLRDTIGAFAPLLKRTLRDDIALDLRLPAALGLVRADTGALEQILLNLVMNAQEAMPGGGRLTIELADMDLLDPDRPAHPGLAPGPYVTLRVVDTGIGMDASTASRIFEPFFTTKSRGTGLGLATTYGLVQQHAGTVEVSSSPGQGTAFTILFPRSPGEKKPSSAPASPEAAAAVPAGTMTDDTLRGTETILVVDDSGVVRELAAGSLGRLGYRVLLAASGEEALARCDEEPGLDLVITDVVMPEMDGVELSRRLRARRPGLKVLFMSGYEREAVARRGAVEDGMSLLTKPFLVTDLARAVRRMFAGGG